MITLDITTAARVFAAALGLAAFASPAVAQLPSPAPFKNYTEYWADASRQKSVTACNEGQAQSPVDIKGATRNNNLGAIVFKYDDYPVPPSDPNGYSFFRWYDTGHGFELQLAAEDYRNNRNLPAVPERGITLDGVFYELKQIHIHNPSEHTLNGRSFSAEMHLVHGSKTANRTVVLAVFLDGDQFPANNVPHAGLQPLTASYPLYNNRGVMKRSDVRLTQLLPQPLGSNYVRYDGSLTTPPCTENVTWIVFNQPLAISFEQLTRIKNRYVRNARPVQPTNGRALQSRP